MKDFDFNTCNVDKICQSDQFGELRRADILVRRSHEPKNSHTTEFVTALLGGIGIHPTGAINTRKYLRAMSDFLVATKRAESRLIGWLGGKDNYIGGKPYGYDIMRKVKVALEEHGVIQRAQKSSKRDGLVRLYRVDADLDVSSLSFSAHGEGPEVIVRSQKRRNDKGQIVGGNPLSRKGFLPEIQTLEAQMRELNLFFAGHPLQTLDGLEMCFCHRIFNDGSLKVGGRIYGSWQNMPEAQRLQMAIDSEAVCEIDIKASFLNIANSLWANGDYLGKDPYTDIPFVAQGMTERRSKELRKAAKILVASYISKKGDTQQFPKGKPKTIEGERKTIPFKTKYGLTEKYSYYMGQILKVFPFLSRVKTAEFDFMYTEVGIILGAIEELKLEGIPAYPVHDCIIVSQSNKERAVEVLQEKLLMALGNIPEVDISYISEDGEFITEYVQRDSSGEQVQSDNLMDTTEEVEWVDDSDFEVIDDY